MGLAGDAAVAIWHDIALEGRDEFYRWHGEEHMPERVEIPGFIRGRRYAAMRARPEFFNLYEASSPDVLRGPDYLSRLNSPTPWTTAVVKHFRNVARSICQVAYTAGQGGGGLVATVRYDVPDILRADHLACMRDEFLPHLLRQQGIAGVHLLMADVDASKVRTEEQKDRAEANEIPAWILLAEGWGDIQAFQSLCDTTFHADFLNGVRATGPKQVGIYRLQNVRTEVDGNTG